MSISSNRIAIKLADLKTEDKKALVPFITAGDPSKESTVGIMHALVKAGADIIELGVPFSDPMADGPTIQRSSERALERGVNTNFVFQSVKTFREQDSETPVVLMGYLNPIEMRGLDTYARQAVESGVDGVLLVDLPPEEAEPVRIAFNQQGLKLISLAAPTTTPERLHRLANESQGYLYYVSFAGVTGASGINIDEVLKKASALRQQSKVPVMIGFGYKDAASAKALAPAADGIVIGSALVEVLAASTDPAAAAEAFLKPIRDALDSI
ncbi:MAG: tryptophan synthase subunit alpha [Methylococcales bacterium]